jgi:wyosine [tRNA(Phe)-imidazoG37] synthetase (radical SAM superfamily)
MTNCSRISISGGEPLLYPHILDVVRFISEQGIRSVILSNGDFLTPKFARELRDAGLFQFFLHVDCGQNRPGWKNKTETEMNKLRQYYADLIYKTGNLKCGFNMTIRNSNLHEVLEIVRWFRANIDRVNHISFITFRGIPTQVAQEMQYRGEKIELNKLPDAIKENNEINISSNDVFNVLQKKLDHVHPSAYLHGTASKETFKLITINNIGSKHKIYGALGAKSMKKYQELNHMLKRKYDASVLNFGKWVFLMTIFDGVVGKTLSNFLKSVLQKPSSLFEKIYLQSLVIQQPFEIFNGKLNLCDGCINLMPFKGEMINSCRLDEYRLLGGPINYDKETSKQLHFKNNSG